MIKRSSTGNTHIMNLSADKKTLVLIEPNRDPASTATKVDEANLNGNEILGKWNWCHDGKNKNGRIVIKPNGKVWSWHGGDTGFYNKL